MATAFTPGRTRSMLRVFRRVRITVMRHRCREAPTFAKSPSRSSSDGGPDKNTATSTSLRGLACPPATEPNR